MSTAPSGSSTPTTTITITPDQQFMDEVASELDAFQRELATGQEVTASLTEQVEQQQTRLEANGALITQLNARITQLEENGGDHTEEIERLGSQIKTLTQVNNELHDRIDLLSLKVDAQAADFQVARDTHTRERENLQERTGALWRGVAALAGLAVGGWIPMALAWVAVDRVVYREVSAEKSTESEEGRVDTN